MISDWTAICTSPTFAELYAQLGSRNLTSGYELAGSTGHYVANYGFQWVVSCSGFTNRTDEVCEKAANWYVDLVTGGVDGPVNTEWAAVPTGSPSLVPGPDGGQSGDALLGLSTGETAIVFGGIAVGSAVVIAAALLLRNRRRRL